MHRYHHLDQAQINEIETIEIEMKHFHESSKAVWYFWTSIFFFAVVGL